MAGTVQGGKFPDYVVHSANCVGAPNIVSFIDSFNRVYA